MKPGLEINFIISVNISDMKVHHTDLGVSSAVSNHD